MIKKERENLHKERQKLIHPIRETDERVRSKSEVIIADILNQEGIPYRYECPLQLKGWGKVYPDFTVLSERERPERRRLIQRRSA